MPPYSLKNTIIYLYKNNYNFLCCHSLKTTAFTFDSLFHAVDVFRRLYSPYLWQ